MRLFRWCAIMVACVATLGEAQSPIVLDSATEARLIYPQTYFFDFKGDGARAAGMGHAFMAVSDDISAGSWNPAGLYSAELVTFGFSLVSFRPGGSGVGDIDAFTSYNAEPDDYGISGAFTGEVKLVRLIAPLRIKGHPFVFSFGNNRTFDDYQQFAFEDSYMQQFVTFDGIKFYFDTSRIDLSIHSRTHTKMNSVNIAFGTRLFQNLSGGFGLNVFGGSSIRYETQRAFVDSLRYAISQFTDYERDVTHYDTTRFTGYNVTVGFKYTQPRWNGALVFKTPFTLGAKLDSLTYTVSSIVNSFGQKFPLEEETDTVIIPRSLTKYDVPMGITLAGSYLVNENMLVSADLEYRGWEGKKIKVRIDEQLVPGSSNKETFVEKDPHWQNVISLRVGGEYTFETGIGRIPVRAGLGSIGIPSPEAQITVDYDTLGNALPPEVSFSSKRMTTASVGLGIHWSQIHLDWAVVRTMLDQSTYRDLGADLSRSRDFIIGFGSATTKSRSTSILFSFTGIF